jgi:prepilin-type N-terminal cleavage/methylation domain-containing protein
VFGKSKHGFTLIELLITIAIIAVLSAIVLPNMTRSQVGYERKSFIAALNSLLKYAQSHAIITYTNQQIVLDLKNRIMELREQTDKKDPKGEIIYRKAPSGYINTTVKIPENIDVKNFIIEGFDEMGRSSIKKTGDFWFFVVPEGMAQEVTMNFVDTQDRLYNDKPRPIGLVLNPFTAQFKEYDTFQK